MKHIQRMYTNSSDGTGYARETAIKTARSLAVKRSQSMTVWQCGDIQYCARSTSSGAPTLTRIAVQIMTIMADGTEIAAEHGI